MSELLTIFRRSPFGKIGLVIVTFFVLLAIIGPYITPHDPWKTADSIEDILSSPSLEHPLGTDELGRDILSQIIYGTRISLIIGFASAAIAVVVGTAVGVLSGYFGGKLDGFFMRVTDAFLAMPFIILAIVLVSLLGRSLGNIILAIGLVQWTQTARITRSQTLTVKERVFVLRAKAIGGNSLYIMRKHILPNVLPLVFANMTLVTSLAILSEAFLSFLGLGDPTKFSWGITIRYAFETGAAAIGAWWYFLPAGLCIMAVVLGFTFISNTLDEAFNPKLRRGRTVI
jgi:peptide/nickel transport system permease protein